MYFIAEIGLRIFALTPSVFFKRKHWFNAVDLAIVAGTFLVSLVYTVAIEVAVVQGVFDATGTPGELTGFCIMEATLSKWKMKG